MTGRATDPLPLASALIARRSVTPEDDGAQDVLATALSALGLKVSRLDVGRTRNLFARIGSGRPHLCFAGHTDVVPAGGEGWTRDAFEPALRDGVLYGRGACDMKGAIACFVAALTDHLADGTGPGTLSLLITGDEEGDATDGTVRVVEWLQARGELPDFCLVGEPTNPERLGETIKVGRRGSMNVSIEVHGVQGHVAYPHRADNPVHRLLALLAELVATPLDEGSAFFAPSGLQVTSVDVGNPATNVIPSRAAGRLNVRFNDRQEPAALEARIRAVIERHAPAASVEIRVGALPFLAGDAPETGALAEAVRTVTGRTPRLETSGGTSDARFLAPHCRVAEFGLVGASMHQVDEHVPVADLHALAAVYRAWLGAVAPR